MTPYTLRPLRLCLLPLALAACADRLPTSSDYQPPALDLAPRHEVRAYVSNFAADVVSALDVASRSVIAEIPVGDQPQGVAITPDGSRAYVAETQSDRVSVIATSINVVIGTIAVGDGPTRIAISPDGSRGYVANSPGASVSVIDLATNAVIATIPVERDWLPGDLAVSPDGAKVYGTNIGGDPAPAPRDGIVVIDAATLTLDGYIPTDFPDPFRIDFTAAGDRAYIAQINPGIEPKIAILDPATEAMTIFTLPGTQNLLGMSLSADESRLYVAAHLFPATPTDAVLIVDAANPSVILGTISIGDGPWGLVLTPDGQHILVTNTASNTVSVIATATNSVVATIPTAEGPLDITAGLVRVDAAAAVTDLEEAIDHLVETGSIGSGQAHGLRNKLRNAQRQLERGNVNAARALLEAFINQLEAYVAAGVVSAADAGPLLAAARALLAGLGG